MSQSLTVLMKKKNLCRSLQMDGILSWRPNPVEMHHSQRVGCRGVTSIQCLAHCAFTVQSTQTAHCSRLSIVQNCHLEGFLDCSTCEVPQDESWQSSTTAIATAGWNDMRHAWSTETQTEQENNEDTKTWRTWRPSWTSHQRNRHRPIHWSGKRPASGCGPKLGKCEKWEVYIGQILRQENLKHFKMKSKI